MASSDLLTLASVLLAGNGIIQYLISYALARKDKKRKEDGLILETLSIQSYCNLKQECTSLLAQGYATETDRRFLHKMYDNYKEYGWNGDMDAMMKRVDELPYDIQNK